MVETEELLITTSTRPRLAFRPEEAAKLFNKIRESVRAARQDNQYKSSTEDHHVETTPIDETFFCNDCGDDMDTAVSVIELREMSNSDVQQLCCDCAEELAQELEDYAIEYMGDSLAELLDSE